MSVDEATIVAKAILRAVAKVEREWIGLHLLEAEIQDDVDVHTNMHRDGVVDRLWKLHPGQKEARDKYFAQYPEGYRARPAAGPEEEDEAPKVFLETPRGLKAWTEMLITTMVDKESAEKAMAQFHATMARKERILNAEQVGSLSDIIREARDKVVPVDFGEEEFGRPGEESEPEPGRRRGFEEEDRPAGEERAGANGSTDAAAVAKMVKDYNDSHPPAPDYTLAKYRLQTND